MALNMTILRERLREAFGKDSQETVGKRLNMTQGNVSKLLAGLQQPTLETVFHVAEIYDVSVDWLLGISEKKNKVDIASYASDIEMMTNLRNLGVIRVGKERNGDPYIQIKDPIFKNLFIKSLALFDTDSEIYQSWVDSKLSAFGDKPLLMDIVWEDEKVAFLASEAMTESNWLEVHAEARKAEERYIDIMSDNPGPFGE